MNKDIFTKYYRENSWRGKESVSGPGSDYDQTKYLVPELQLLINELSIKSILDVPCGDFNWMKNINMKDVEYTGGDIVNDLILKNNKRYRKNNIKFEVIDLLTDTLPTVDLIIVRDCLVHLPNNDVAKAINNIRDSKSKYLLTTTFTWKSFENNKDIAMGGWRRLNLEQYPFNLPFPKKIIVEGNTQSNDKDKTVSLWEIKDIPKVVIN